MDPLAVVLLRRTGMVVVPGSGPAADDGPVWAGALEADLADRGRVLHRDLRAAATRLPRATRVQWADWLLAALDEQVGADRTMVPLYRRFPDTPRDADSVYIRRLLSHLLAVPGAPCTLCGRDEGGEPLDPCGHPVCRACFPPEEFSACPICGRRLTAGTPYLPVSGSPAAARTGPPVQVRLLGLETEPAVTAVRLRDELVARPGALSEADRDDLKVLVTATAPTTLDWVPDTVPARETQALLLAWALHATVLTDDYPAVLSEAQLRWETATDAARTLWAYSGGDPGLILSGKADGPGPDSPGGPGRPLAPGEAWRPVDEPAVTVPVTRVRRLSRPLRRAVLAHLDFCGAAEAAEDLRRHPTVWKRLGEQLHPHEQVAAHPGAAVAFAALRGTRTTWESPLGAAIVDACAADPRRLVRTSHPDGTVSVHVHTHAAAVEHAFSSGDVSGAVRLLAQRPGDLWRRMDHVLRASGPDGFGLVETVARDTAGRVAPGVLAAAAAELAGRDSTVQASEEQLAVMAQARAAGRLRAHDAAYSTISSTGTMAEIAVRSLRDADAGGRAPVAEVHDWDAAAGSGAGSAAGPNAASGAGPAAGSVAGSAAGPGIGPRAGAETGAAGIVGGRPGPGMPRRVFFPKGSAVTTWTEPERRDQLPAAAITTVRDIVDSELTRRAALLDRFDVAVIDAALAAVPAPMRERAASGQFAGWPRGSVRELPASEVLRLFLHWQDTAVDRVDLDLSCVFFDADWRRAGHCDYTDLRFAGDAAVHSGDLTSAPGPLGATEFLDLNLPLLAAAGVRYVVPVVISYNAVPFDALTEAFAGLMLPVPGGAQFAAGRVEQRFDLRGNARMLMPMVVDLTAGRLLWADLALSGRGYGHSVGRHGDQFARAAADIWEHFAGGNRATLLDLLAWHAAGRADRILVAHPDGTWSEVDATVTAIREAATQGSGRLAELDGLAGRTVLAATTDPAVLERMVPAAVAEGSVALTVTGQAPEPWTRAQPAEALGLLSPA